MLKNYYRAYRNKITNKLRGTVHVKAAGKRRGVVLLSYQTSPFTKTPREAHSDPHSSYWESTEIARLFAERGFDVDVIDHSNKMFVPKKPYAMIVDIRGNIERLADRLPEDCVKIYHVVSADIEFQNAAEERRLDELYKRRGAKLSPRRKEAPTKSPALADYLEGFGNETIRTTYAKYGKPIFPIPISVTKELDFPAGKDFGTARRSFVWFGGGGAVHKGLDLALEAFARMPELELHVIGPVENEADFVEAYRKELFGTKNIVLHRRPRIDILGNMRVGDEDFASIAQKSIASVYPSCSEGVSGSVVQAMHAALIPVVPRTSGIDADKAGGIVLDTCSVDEIMKAARGIAAEDGAKLEKRAREAWQYARTNYTKETFSKAYASFIDMVISKHGK